MRIRFLNIFIPILAIIMQTGQIHADPENISLSSDKDELVFFLPMKESPITKQIVDLWGKVGEKIGIPINVMSLGDVPEDIRDDKMKMMEWAKELAKNDGIDITIVAPTAMFRLEEEGAEFIPIATYQIDKKKTDKPCILVKKGSPYLEIEDPKARLNALKGKPIGIGHGLKSNPIGDMILLDNGINTRSDEFFNYVGTFGGLEDRITETIDGTIEAFMTFKVDLKFAKDKEQLKELAPLVCGGEYTNMPIIFRKTLGRDVITAIRKLILKIHNDLDFPQLKFLFVAVNGHFVPVRESDFDNWRTIYDKGRKEGWITDIGEVTYPKDDLN